MKRKFHKVMSPSPRAMQADVMESHFSPWGWPTELMSCHTDVSTPGLKSTEIYGNPEDKVIHSY